MERRDVAHGRGGAGISAASAIVIRIARGSRVGVIERWDGRPLMANDEIAALLPSADPDPGLLLSRGASTRAAGAIKEAFLREIKEAFLRDFSDDSPCVFDKQSAAGHGSPAGGGERWDRG